MHPVEMIDNSKFLNHSFLGQLVLMPTANCCDMNRGNMFSMHLDQCIQVINAKPPLVNTTFENEYSKYSSGYKELEGKWKVLTKIEKNKYNYAMIIKKIALSKKEEKLVRKGKEIEFPVGCFHVVFRQEAVNLTEKYGYINNNEVIDNLQKNDFVKNEIIYKDSNRDEEMNFQYGLDANSVYLAHEGQTTEDSIICSVSASKKYSTPTVSVCIVTLNTNDVLTNMYGNKKFYKCFPDIGEDIKYGLLCGSRRINYDSISTSLSNMEKILPSDTTYKLNGKVIDISVISNVDDMEELSLNDYNKQICHYYNQEQKYYRNFVNYLTKIVETKENIISDDLIHFYNRYKMLIDPNMKYRVDKNLFDHLMVKFTILNVEPLKVGSKITGRYGNKGVISKIIPDDEMPKIKDFSGYGKPDEESLVNFDIDFILNPLGVPNRINIAQLIEQEINYNSKIIRYNMENMWEDSTLEEIKDYLLDYIKVVNKNQYKICKNYMESLEDEDLEELLVEIIENGIMIQQKPFYDNVNVEGLKKIYEYTGAKKSKFEDLENEVIFGEEYFIVLKHTPASKFSARSVDKLSIKNLPVKTNSYKSYKTNYSSNCIKLGEMEVSGLSIANPANKGSIKVVKNLLDAYANNEEDRLNLLHAQLTKNPFNFDFDLSNTESVNIKIIKSFINCIQQDLVDEEE